MLKVLHFFFHISAILLDKLQAQERRPGHLNTQSSAKPNLICLFNYLDTKLDASPKIILNYVNSVPYIWKLICLLQIKA